MANYPTSISTNANLYIAVNGLQTTLASAINNSVTTIPLTSTSGFPTTGLVTINNLEVVSYTGISGSNLTGCTRGADGTSALAHNAGVTVGLTVVAAHHNLLKDEIIAIETSLGTNLSNVLANPSAVALTIQPTTNQLILGTTRTVTINAPTPATASRVVTLPDLSGDYSVIGTIGAQSIAGIKTFTSQMLGADGSVSLPQYAFSSDTDCGLYRIGANDIAFATNGVKQLEINTTNVISSLAVFAPDGTLSLPGYSFTSDPDTGIQRNSANVMNFITNGAAGLQVSSTDTYIMRGQFYTQSGTAALPGHAFDTDSDSGLYRIGANNIALSTNGVRALEITSSQAVNIKGTSTNDNAAAGDVGEVISASVTYTTPTALTSGSALSITSISLTAGQWSIVAMGGLKPTAATTSITNKVMAIGRTNNTQPGSGVYMVPNANGEVQWDDTILAYIPGNGQQVVIGTVQSVMKLSATTTVYLIEQVGFSGAGATCSGFGSITATRVR